MPPRHMRAHLREIPKHPHPPMHRAHREPHRPRHEAEPTHMELFERIEELCKKIDRIEEVINR